MILCAESQRGHCRQIAITAWPGGLARPFAGPVAARGAEADVPFAARGADAVAHCCVSLAARVAADKLTIATGGAELIGLREEVGFEVGVILTQWHVKVDDDPQRLAQACMLAPGLYTLQPCPVLL